MLGKSIIAESGDARVVLAWNTIWRNPDVWFEKIRKGARGENLKFQKIENAMSAEREHVELLARGSPQVTSHS